MSTREIVLELLDRLPADASLHDVARELEFVAGVREGLGQLERGEGVAIEDVETMLPRWTRRPTA